MIEAEPVAAYHNLLDLRQGVHLNAPSGAVQVVLAAVGWLLVVLGLGVRPEVEGLERGQKVEESQSKQRCSGKK